MEEFNKQQAAKNEIPKTEHSDIGQPDSINEYSNAINSEPIKEYGSYKKAKAVSKATSIAITIIGASLVIGSFLTFALTTNKVTTEVARFELQPEATSISYVVEIASSKSDALKLKLHGLYIDLIQNISVGENVGSFEGLVPDTKYEISIIEKDVIVGSSKSVTTASYTEEA